MFQFIPFRIKQQNYLSTIYNSTRTKLDLMGIKLAMKLAKKQNLQHHRHRAQSKPRPKCNQDYVARLEKLLFTDGLHPVGLSLQFFAKKNVQTFQALDMLVQTNNKRIAVVIASIGGSTKH